MAVVAQKFETEKGFPNNLPTGWAERLREEASKEYFEKLCQFLKSEYRSNQTIFPAKENILRALQLTDFDQVRVVILGQDPYHGVGQAMGLCFAVPNEYRPKPPSLINIFSEISKDLKIDLSEGDSDLTGWAKQGVLLLNSVLTVRKNQAFSHRDRGWEFFTDRIIQLLNERHEPLVFILWGSPARKKKALIDCKRHFVLEAAHPSPLSAHRGFFGCRHFSKANEILTTKIHRPPIEWAKISA